MNRTDKIVCALLRAGLADKPDDPKTLLGLSALLQKGTYDWPAVYRQATTQGVQAIVWDGLQRLTRKGILAPEHLPSRELRLQWGCNVEIIEQVYARQKKLIGKLAAFYASHDIPMMVLKGYGLSLCYPVPEHRPCGDIDIWLYGKQQQADDVLRKEKKMNIDQDKHHHTVFVINGIMVENHYDFLNIHAHRSNRVLENMLREWVSNPEETINVEGEQIALPSPQFNALFLLRHAGAHFAAAEINLRHVTDWAVFVRKYAENIDWTALENIAREMNMHRFLHCLNAISIDLLGLDSDIFPSFDRDPILEKRVTSEILHPEFTEKPPQNPSLPATIRFKFRRWYKNRWKHRIVYREKMPGAFVRLAWSHFLKPQWVKN